MYVIQKMIIFSMMTISVLISVAYLVSPIVEIAGRDMSSFVGAILLSICLIAFGMINDKIRWMKLS